MAVGMLHNHGGLRASLSLSLSLFLFSSSLLLVSDANNCVALPSIELRDTLD